MGNCGYIHYLRPISLRRTHIDTMMVMLLWCRDVQFPTAILALSKRTKGFSRLCLADSIIIPVEDDGWSFKLINIHSFCQTSDLSGPHEEDADKGGGCCWYICRDGRAAARHTGQLASPSMLLEPHLYSSVSPLITDVKAWALIVLWSPKNPFLSDQKASAKSAWRTHWERFFFHEVIILFWSRGWWFPTDWFPLFMCTKLIDPIWSWKGTRKRGDMQ